MKDACEKTDSRLIDYLDGTLDTEAHKAVEDHLAVCATCRTEYEWLKTAMADLEARFPKEELVALVAAEGRVKAAE